jgi:Uma2 family endonuclease
MSIPHKGALSMWTYREYCQVGDEQRYEIMNGVLCLVPTPSLFHQRISRRLEIQLSLFVEEHDLGEVFDAPIDVVLDEHNTVQPDVVFVSRERSVILQPAGIMGIPDLIIEIISPSSLHRDSYEKKELYERFGVKEYWLVDQANRCIQVFSMKADKYELLCFVAEKGTVFSEVVPGFQLELSQIMAYDRI